MSRSFRSKLGLALRLLSRHYPEVLPENLAGRGLGNRLEDEDATAESLVVRELLLDILGDIFLDRGGLGVLCTRDNYGGYRASVVTLSKARGLAYCTRAAVPSPGLRTRHR